MKIIDVKSAIIGTNIVVRVVTDKGIDGYGAVEYGKDYVQPLIPFFAEVIKGCDPTNVASVVRRMRRLGGFKPWGKIMSAIEMAVWDIAGKDAGLPVYKLLGGKVRDKVRVYNTNYVNPNRPHLIADTPEKVGENILALNELPEGFTIAKMGVGFHGHFHENISLTDYTYNAYPDPNDRSPYKIGGLLTEKGLHSCIDRIARVKDVIKDRVGLAVDCGPGMTSIDALRLAKAVEPLNLLWLEDTIAGDFTPYTLAHIYRDITMNTTTPIHTGEQLYLRENCRELIETHAINVIGPDPADVGGIAELKWIAEYADLHGIMMAPHGVADGLFGIAALTHVCSTMPDNYIAFEFGSCMPEWWYDIVDGLPDQLIRGGHITVWDKPGLGVEFNINKASKYLREEDKTFFLS
ncbi:mandelate racemase/muconate lactonizing enzyme family protein [Paenibacillus montanisoli]|uniref:Mandelate racemase/muconate lactonizing enzyme family protein n=1 Tax=Paenibacillus montanisoli TaxID=2081970 RepID=A0A328U782_9BACL|nr:mandelate racemase/muconate lactonizing enzyme family protein [Paenibacillus montanisoli]RAP78728.1 mandelate racemase/muconate lactonizing enzyme family protein [Paenibacillus montanisoli]